MSNEQLYLAIGLPVIVNLLFNGFMFLVLNNRVTNLENRVHTGHDLLIGKIGELDTRIARLEEKLQR